MEPPRKNGTVTYLMVVGAAVLWILYQWSPSSTGSVVVDVTTLVPSAQGVITSIETTSSGKDALVKLDGGKTVRASIPPACVVFPGQIAQLHSWGSLWGANQYTVLSAKDNDI